MLLEQLLALVAHEQRPKRCGGGSCRTDPRHAKSGSAAASGTSLQRRAGLQQRAHPRLRAGPGSARRRRSPRGEPAGPWPGTMTSSGIAPQSAQRARPAPAGRCPGCRGCAARRAARRRTACGCATSSTAMSPGPLEWPKYSTLHRPADQRRASSGGRRTLSRRSNIVVPRISSSPSVARSVFRQVSQREAISCAAACDASRPGCRARETPRRRTGTPAACA